ncbi:Gfo/Idh/MocA family protein [Devosia submarina]|uniref:Gfo/Idh/MocA family protein n=1 Tax=Devosia submarina TaxID=1173082 RepID=UPI000D3464BB|nr:Gfo/Idh/MocA family oxidoreductase [Devosia submarina]
MLKLCTLGAGYFSQFHYRAWQRINEVQLVGICDRDANAANRVGAGFPSSRTYVELEAMLDTEQPDVLDVIVPPSGHLPAIRAAAARGIHVICQKPFCGALADAEVAATVAAQANITLIVHENFRFQPWYSKLHQILSSGVLGEVYGATFRLRPGDGQGDEAYLARQPYFRDMPRFMVHETGIHYVDVFRYLFGEVKAVTARLRRINPVIAGEDAGLVVLEMMDGITAVLDANRLADHPASNRRRTLGEMLVETEAGAVAITGNGEIYLRKHGENLAEQIDYEWQDVDFGGDCVYRTQVAAIRALLGQGPLVNTAAQYLANLCVEEAIYESHEQGRRIALN